MHQIKPIQNETIAISHPHNIIQKMLTRKFPALLLYSTQRPNGYKTNPANFRHCIPRGIPINVIKQSNAAINHNSEIIPPPNRNHIMFPKIFILLPHIFILSTGVLVMAYIIKFHIYAVFRAELTVSTPFSNTTANRRITTKITESTVKRNKYSKAPLVVYSTV